MMSFVFHYKHPLLFTAFFALLGIFIPPIFAIVWVPLALVGLLFFRKLFPEISLATVVLCLSWGNAYGYKQKFNQNQQLLYKGYPLQLHVYESKVLGTETKIKARVGSYLHKSHWCLMPSYRVDVKFHNAYEIPPGAVLYIRAYTTDTLRTKRFPADFDALSYQWGSNRLATLKADAKHAFILKIDSSSPSFFRNKVVVVLYQKMKFVLSESAWSWYEGLLLGDKSDMDLETKSAFQKAGLMHILSVSGMHLGLIYWVLTWPLKRLSKRCKQAVYLECLLIPLLWMYAYLTGMAPPVFRATTFITVMIVSRVLLKRKVRLADLLASMSILQAFFDPLLCYSISYQLSVAAMLGLAFWYPLWEAYFEGRTYGFKWFFDLIGISICCTLSTLPLTLYHFHVFATWFFVGNVVFTFPLTLVIYAFLLLTALMFLPMPCFALFVAKGIHFLMGGITSGLQMMSVLPLPYLYSYDFCWEDLVLLIALQGWVWRSQMGYNRFSFSWVKSVLLIWMLWAYFRVPGALVSGEINSQMFKSPHYFKEYTRWLQSQTIDTLFLK
jgi:ComEC/Rec2-related protein